MKKLFKNILAKFTNLKLFTRILCLYVIILTGSLLMFTQYVSRNSFSVVKESQEGICIQKMTALQNIMNNKMNTVKDILFKIYEDEDIFSFVMEMVNENSDSYTLENSYEKKKLVKKFDTMTKVDSKLSELIVYSNSSQKAYLYSTNSSFFDQNTEIIKKIPRLKSTDLQPFVMPSHKGKYDGRDSNGHYFGIATNIIYPSTSLLMGRMVFDFGISDMENIFKENGKMLKGYILVLTKDGDVVFDSSGKYYGYKYPYWDSVQQPSESVLLEKESIVKIINSESDRFIYVGILTKPELYNELNIFKNSTYIAAIILLLFIFLLYFSVTSIISKRINVIVKAMGNTVKSNLLYRIPLKNKNDEFEHISVHFNKMCDNLQEYINKSYAYELKQKTAEIKILENQINPHFLYNSLEAIRASLDIEDHEDGAEMIHSLAMLFRVSLKADSVVHIFDEIELCIMYIKIFDTRYKNCFEASFDIDPSIMNYGIIKLILQPILENYIIHGFDLTRKDNRLSIKGYQYGPDICITISDNGNGIEPGKLAEIKQSLRESVTIVNDSIGLSNVNERISLLFGFQYGLEIDSVLYKGTSITLRFPAKTPEEIRNLMTSF